MPRPQGAPGASRISPGGFPSPSQQPKKYFNQMQNATDNMVAQLQGNPKGQRPRSAIGKPKERTIPPDPNADPNAPPQTGTEQLGTYASGIDPSQFQNENFKRQGLKGTKLGGGFGGFGDFGRMLGMGMGGGGMFGGGMDPMMMQFLQYIFPQMMGQFSDEDQGPIAGR